MKMKINYLRNLGFASALVLAAGASAAQAEPIQSLGAPEGVVDIVAWPGYIERGETTLLVPIVRGAI